MKFKYKGENFELDVKECKTISSKISGLMFRKKSPCLLFYFGKLRRWRIHSFFCRPFFAIWFNGDKIVDGKFVKPWIFWIQPKEKFDKLLEIPSNSEAFSRFVDERNL